MRSFLMVPGADGEKLNAALTAGADLVVVDFEDTVEDKAAARALATEFLESGPTDFKKGVRMNPVCTEEGVEDLAFFIDAPVKPDIVSIPRINHAAELAVYAAACPAVPSIPIIETPLALERVFEIANADAPIAGLFMGGKDLSIYSRCERSWEGLFYARGRTAQAAASAGILCFDEAYRPLDDLEGLRALSHRVKGLGYTGKVAIDPRHIDIINDVFRGSDR